MQELNTLSEVIIAQDEYIKLLGDELDEVAGLAFVHGWSSTRHEQGKEQREKIQRLKTEAGIV